MTKQQLREAIRKIIKAELNEALTTTEKEELDLIEDELKYRVKTESSIPTKMLARYKELKAKAKMDEAQPAIAPTKPSPGPAIAPGRPGTDAPKPRRPLGNPDVKPAPKATMTEAEMLAKIIKRFKAKKNG
jgi:hypothetical protein